VPNANIMKHFSLSLMLLKMSWQILQPSLMCGGKAKSLPKQCSTQYYSQALNSAVKVPKWKHASLFWHSIINEKKNYTIGFSCQYHATFLFVTNASAN
jgi:hypothetical protein